MVAATFNQPRQARQPRRKANDWRRWLNANRLPVVPRGPRQPKPTFDFPTAAPAPAASPFPPASVDVAATEAATKPARRILPLIASIAADYCIDAADLADTAQHFYETARDQHAAREAAKAAARKRTGLTRRDVSRIENSYHDYSSAFRVSTAAGRKMRHFDAYARELARECPELGLGDPDDMAGNLAECLWAVLSEGRLPAPRKNDRKIIEQAARFLAVAEQFARPFYSDLADVPF